MRTNPIVAGLPALALAALFGACNKGPTRPTARPTVDPVVIRMEIGGPGSVPPGETARFTATAQLSDRSSRDVTNEARWQSSQPSVLSIGATGVVTAHQGGETTITAQFQSVSSVKEVFVLPAGTYRLVGLVTEAGAPNAVVADAHVEVTAGPAAGLFTTTGQDGRYRFYGVSGDVSMRVTKDGYQQHVQSISVADHQTQNFQLTLQSPRPDVSGMYTLTITAADDCRDNLPEEARSRTYTAALIQEGPHVDVKLTGATFALSARGLGDHFRGRVEPNGVTFLLNPYGYAYYSYAQYPDLVEHIAPSTYLSVDGSVTTPVSHTHLSGTLSGTFQLFTSDLRWGAVAKAKCSASGNRFVLSREENR